MKRMIVMGIATTMLAIVLSACGKADQTEDSYDTENSSAEDKAVQAERDEMTAYTKNTRIEDVANDPVFGEYGRLIFPADTGYYSGNTLGELGLIWYNNIDPDKTVEITNYMKEHRGCHGILGAADG